MSSYPRLCILCTLAREEEIVLPSRGPRRAPRLLIFCYFFFFVLVDARHPKRSIDTHRVLQSSIFVELVRFFSGLRRAWATVTGMRSYYLLLFGSAGGRARRRKTQARNDATRVHAFPELLPLSGVYRCPLLGRATIPALLLTILELSHSFCTDCISWCL